LAQLVLGLAACDRWLVVLLARPEAGVLVRVGDIRRRLLRCIVAEDGPIRIAVVVGWLVRVLDRMFVVRILVRWATVGAV
jgi:hypothetical protein